jgi:sugar/nucleoside kinase (ribokinase family)
VEKGGQRTMRTYLGASLKMGASHFDEHVERLAFEGGRGGADANAKSSSITPSGSTLLHVEGYTLYRPELARTAMAAAKRRGALVSLDLASFEVVRNCRAQLVSLLEDGLVDLLFCNEDEAAELLGETRAPDAFAREDAGRAMEWMLRYVQVATVSLGARGCVTRDRRGDRGVSPGAR